GVVLGFARGPGRLFRDGHGGMVQAVLDPAADVGDRPAPLRTLATRRVSKTGTSLAKRTRPGKILRPAQLRLQPVSLLVERTSRQPVLRHHRRSVRALRAGLSIRTEPRALASRGNAAGRNL